MDEPRIPLLVAVGVSAGGLTALSTLLSGLPADFRGTVVIVQHRGRDSTLLCGLLQATTPLPVSEVVDKEPIEPGHIYLAAPDYHLLLEPGLFSLSTDDPVRFSRPSIDVMLSSAAEAYGPAVLGIVLTGANEDGALGLRCIVDAGGRAAVQDPSTAEAPAMPEAARRRVPEAVVLPLEELAAYATRAAEEALDAQHAEDGRAAAGRRR